jgi:hypothetical protein
MAKIGGWLKRLGLCLGIGVASVLTTTAPAIAGSVRIDGTGFSLQLGDHPVPYHIPTYPTYKYIYPPYYYHPPLTHIPPAVPYYYYSHPVTPSITITPKGTTIILPFTVIQRSTTRFYYYGF